MPIGQAARHGYHGKTHRMALSCLRRQVSRVWTAPIRDQHLNLAGPHTTEKTSVLEMNGGIRQPLCTMLLLTRAATVSPSLLHALARECPWVLVEQTDRIEDACRSFGQPVALILVDGRLLGEAEANAAQLHRHHPDAMVALLERDASRPAGAAPDILASPLVRSVLPLHLPLDIWLAVVRLLLAGGEYYPLRMMQPQRPGSESTIRAKTSVPRHLAALTSREVQILELVSQGLQNKSIAASCALSESTVKIHIHNIIAKLGVHNRTEAAARLRSSE